MEGGAGDGTVPRLTLPSRCKRPAALTAKSTAGLQGEKEWLKLWKVKSEDEEEELNMENGIFVPQEAVCWLLSRGPPPACGIVPYNLQPLHHAVGLVKFSTPRKRIFFPRKSGFFPLVKSYAQYSIVNLKVEQKWV